MEITQKIIENYIGIKLSQTSQLSKKTEQQLQEKATTVIAHNRNKISVRQLSVNNCNHRLY